MKIGLFLFRCYNWFLCLSTNPENVKKDNTVTLDVMHFSEKISASDYALCVT